MEDIIFSLMILQCIILLGLIERMTHRQCDRGQGDCDGDDDCLDVTLCVILLVTYIFAGTAGKWNVQNPVFYLTSLRLQSVVITTADGCMKGFRNTKIKKSG